MEKALLCFMHRGFIFFNTLCHLSGRFKEYQDLFPPRSVEFEFVEAQAVPRKPSKSTTHLHDSQVSEREEGRTLQAGKPLSRHYRLYKRLSLLGPLIYY